MGNIFVAKVLASMSAQPAGAAPDLRRPRRAPLEPIRPGPGAAWARSLGDEPAMARTGETVPTVAALRTGPGRSPGI